MTTHITINNTIPRIRYISNGVLDTYTYPFAIFKDSDLKVYFGSTQQESSTYSVSGAGSSSGGTLTLSNTFLQPVTPWLTAGKPFNKHFFTQIKWWIC